MKNYLNNKKKKGKKKNNKSPEVSIELESYLKANNREEFLK